MDRKTRNRRLAGAALLLMVCAAGTGAAAQTYPMRPVTMVVPFAAGGPTDTITRIVAERMRVTLGQTVIIENVTGADGSIGVGRAARATPDGYTLSVGQWSTHVLNGAAYTLPYDLVKDFEPIALIATNPEVIVTSTRIPAKDLRELIGWLKPNQGNVSVGMASMSHRVAAVYFQNSTGARFLFVPYRGAGPAMQDLVARQIDMMFDQAANSLPQVRNGTIKAYAVTAKERLASAPEIPTVDEAGLPGFYISVWTALWAPAGTPKAAIAKLNAAVVEALGNDHVRARLADLGQDIPPLDQQTPSALSALQKAEIEKWWPIIKAANIKPE
jgi:tripartite-type tricarboxylate transporter receptor subunit TctC